MLKVLLLSLQAACESLEQFCPCKSPPRKSVSLVWPNGIVVYFEALLLYVILISLFEHSTSKRYPAFANRSMKCGILRGSTGLFIFFTSILGNNSVGFGRIKAIGKSGAKVTRELTGLRSIATVFSSQVLHNSQSIHPRNRHPHPHNKPKDSPA